jgi:hypothetical protein
MRILQQTCTHDGTTIEDSGIVHIVKWKASKHVPCHPTRTQSTPSYGHQRRNSPSSWSPSPSTRRYRLQTPRQQGSVHDGIGSRPGCVRSSIAWRSWTTHAHTMGPSRKGAWCNGLHPTTYRAIRRGRDRRPITLASVGLLPPADA